MEKENINMTITEKNNIIPKIIFVIPYRDREQQYNFFMHHMQNVMSDYSDNEYKIIFIHQCDKRDFNRGAMKNIGFLFVKNEYPDNYKDITLVFNDIDSMPYVKNFLNYETEFGNVKHFYGFNFTLGGIVSIKAGDFEKTNGFLNLWAWGYEDNAFQKKVKSNNLNIDRSVFYPIYDKNILNISDKPTRTVNEIEYKKYNQNINDGFDKLKNIKYDFDRETHFVNVTAFDTFHSYNDKYNKEHNFAKNGNIPFKSSRNKSTMRMIM